MENIWKDLAKAHMDKELFERLEEYVKNSNYHVLVKCDVTNLLGRGESKDGVFLSLETDVSNAFDAAYRNHKANIGTESGRLILDFDNKFSIDNTIMELEKLREAFDNKEDTQWNI